MRSRSEEDVCGGEWNLTLCLVGGLVVALRRETRSASWSSGNFGGTCIYPVPLEAVLRAEEAILDALLQTCWALQGASIVVAVGPQALLLRRRLRGHLARVFGSGST